MMEITWKKRLIAGALAFAMLSGMMPHAIADEGATQTEAASETTAATEAPAAAEKKSASEKKSAAAETTAATEPAPTKPAATEPAPTKPAATEPAPTKPAATEPTPTKPAPTETTAATEPSDPTKPAPTETTAATEPSDPTKPSPTEPTETTVPPASTETTEATEPTETTAPSETTETTEATEPTETTEVTEPTETTESTEPEETTEVTEFIEGTEETLPEVPALFAEAPSAPELTLDRAVELAKLFGDTSSPLEGNGSALTVRNGKGLILLSNVLPSEYKTATITVVVTEGSEYDLTQEITITETKDGVQTEYAYKFLGLGNEANPFAGIIRCADKYPIKLGRTLFNWLSTDATLDPLILKASGSIAGPLFAQRVTGTGAKPWSIQLSDTNSFGGLIGTLAGTANLSVSVTAGTQTCSSLPNAGFFCNTMESDSALTAALTNGGTISVTATSGHAGGFVGEMKANTSLTVSGGGVNTITSTKGNAGGLVGSATDAEIKTAAGTTCSISGTVTASTNAGGLVGKYENRDTTRSIDLSKFAIGGGLSCTSSNGNAGGVFGELTNSSGKLTVKGAAGDSPTTTVTSTLSGSVIGGFAGTYTCSDLTASLKVQNLYLKPTKNNGDTFGGAIGTVPDSCYVEMNDLQVAPTGIGGTFGGLVAKVGEKSAPMLNVGAVTFDAFHLDNQTRGGLIGIMNAGVLRLHGETNLSQLTVNAGNNKGEIGRIVGKNNNGFVYAAAGWSLSAAGDASNIGNWGEVVRLGDTLTEGNSATDLIYFDQSAHTVQINSPAPDENGAYTLNGTRDFAGYALAYNYSGYTTSGALLFQNSVESGSAQNVTLSATVDLKGTGILGIGRDDGNSNPFTGTFNGGSKTITLDIGGTTGTLWAYQWDKKLECPHSKLALFARVGNATIENITVSGKVALSVRSAQSDKGNGNNVNYPLCAAGVAAYQEGAVTYKNVTASAAVTVESDNRAHVAQAGLVAQCAANSVTFDTCTWTNATNESLSNTRTNDQNYVGGLLGYANQAVTLTATNCTLSGAIISEGKGTAYVGGLAAYIKGDGTKTLQISDLKVQGEHVSISDASLSGGLLGGFWLNTEVTFDTDNTSGVTVSGSTLDAGSARFGGLVHKATGYWDATRAGSIQFAEPVNTIKGKSTADATSGLLLADAIDGDNGALYLKVGTWGTKDTNAYSIAPDAVDLQLTSDSDGYFDELVGWSNHSSGLNTNKSAVISLSTGSEKIDESGCNTYTTQLGTNFKSKNTRYYYNLSPDPVNPGALDNAQKVVTWSASQFAASNIRGYLCSKSGDTATISGDIDLSNYSYYPVTPLGPVKVTGTLTFGYDKIQTAESGNKQPSDVDHQHYLMQHGLLYNVSKNVTVTGTTFSGTVGHKDGSGALIFGNAEGSDKGQITISLSDVTLAGLRVLNTEKSTPSGYAPLLINKITGYTKLEVTELGTGAGYTAGQTAASSLIGTVGTPTATKLTLSFKKIALDGRVKAGETSVYNNGTVLVDYNTKKSIFTRATLLDSFQYASNSSGTYNFESTENRVTYGVELSNRMDGDTAIGRNPDKQYEYYNGGFVTDEKDKTDADAAYVQGRYTGEFLRYVYVQEDESQSCFELDINQRAYGLTEGCGTYGHPYIITDGQQLIDVANYINKSTASGVTSLEVRFNSKVKSDKKQVAKGYHTAAADAVDSNGDKGLDEVFTWNGTAWKGEKGGSITTDEARLYLQNAYYKIDRDFDLPIGGFNGIGTAEYPFSGVIVGDSTISLTGTKNNQTEFGGLISYSQGSVVKGVTVDYTGATITMGTNAPAGARNPFFGGVVGYCMGGDTIIDNVSVIYASDSVKLNDRLTAAGGYVGLVGGACEDNKYEKNGGGVVFRNMESHTNTFALEAKNATSYYHCNPYVGRVLDGYACYDGGTPGTSTLDNTDKNYSIPDISGDSGLVVDSSLNVTVTSAQGLWLLSAIVNSGAGAMDSNGAYLDWEDKNYVQAYQYGKPRSGVYNLIGQSGGDSDLADEAYWGGVAAASGTATGRVSFLVKKCGHDTAAKVTGRSSTSNKSDNNAVSLKFNATEIDMRPYKNGFRGIGGSYGQKTSGQTSEPDRVVRRSLRVNGISGISAGTKIYLAMDQHDYESEYESTKWSNQGAGLFTVLMYVGEKDTPCLVQNLTISGSVSVRMYDAASDRECSIKKVSYDMAVSGFVSRPAKSQKQYLKFQNFHLESLNVTGGTSTGGVIGLVECCGQIEITDWSVKNVNVYKWVNNDGSTGGLTGWNHSNNPVIITGYRGSTDKPEALNVENLSVMIKSDSKGNGTLGGLTGANDETAITVQDINVKGLVVKGYKSREIGGLVDGGNKGLTIKNCVLTDITVTEESDTNAIGGILGYNKVAATISDVTIQGASTISAYKNYVGGMVGKTENNLTMTNCRIVGTEDRPIYISCDSSATGGLVGNDNNTTVIKDSELAYVNILSKGESAGGLIGRTGDVSVNVSNITLSSVIAATKKSDKYSGLLVADNNCNTNSLKGYNILADSCKLGYNSSAEVETLKECILAWNNNKTGIWFGNSKTTNNKLVAVAVNGTSHPQKDVGSGLAQITYADYPVDQAYQPTTGTASPYLDVNPKIALKIAGTDRPLTGNGVGFMDGTNPTSIPETILEEATSETATFKKYFNLTGNIATLKKLLSSSNDVYLTTYRDEEKDTTSVPEDVDFPILVVSNTADDAQIWEYIAALTNVSGGAAAKNQVSKVTATTYRWSDETNGFKAQTKSSLEYDKDAKVITVNRVFDNQRSQFTLLDVAYKNPTTTSTNNAGDYFHLYVPVLVKKVLRATFNVSILTGTNYHAASYKGVTHASAGFQEPITAYLSFNYESTDWQDMLNRGENLLWSYKKVLDLIGQGRALPAGTEMTLVDTQTGTVYTHAITDQDNQQEFDLGVFGFEPVPICDLLGIKVAEPADNPDTSCPYVVETDETKATVRIDSTYYRPANEEEASGDVVYLVAAAELVDTRINDETLKLLKDDEGYFLTIRLPENHNETIHNYMTYAGNALRRDRESAALPATLETKNEFHYVFFDSVEQTNFTVKSVRVRSGQISEDTQMENLDQIQITLTSTIQLKDDPLKLFQSYAPDNLYHRFTVNLKKAVGQVTSNAYIGAENVTVTYTAKSSAGKEEQYSIPSVSPKNLDVLVINPGKTDIATWLKNGAESVTVTAVVTLSYGNDVGAIFPPRTGDTDESGIFVCGESSVANVESQLPVSAIKIPKEEKEKRYYTENPSNAALTYEAVNRSGGTDTTSQLGINPYDGTNVNRVIYTEGDYDYSGVDQAVLADAKYIRYTLELYQKGPDGGYGEKVPIGNYLTDVKDSAGHSFTASGQNAMTLDTDYVADDSQHAFLFISFKPRTGTEFETAGYFYANYKVRLTACLLDTDKNVMDNTQASDYVIYTNARILR